jgi:hypothetical protein
MITMTKKFHPILYQTEMVKAILEGKKTKTRRSVKMPPDRIWSHSNRFYGESGREYKCPYGKVGDVLWVRETWQHVNIENDFKDFVYKASGGLDWEMSNEDWKWKPSIFMPKSACRIFLDITDVKVERLQDISEEDAIKEGIQKHIGGYKTNYRQPSAKSYLDGYSFTAQEEFKTLWYKINGPDSWNQNPFVWVISFKRIEKPADFA